MIQNFLIQIFHKLCIICCVFLIICYMEQNGRGVDCFCKSPVHSVMDYRFAVPVCCVTDSRCTVCIPCVSNCAVIQILCSFNIRCCASLVLFICRKRPLCDQSCPLNSVSRSCAVWLKLVVRAVFVAFQIRYPVTGKMLRYTPVIVLCPYQNMVDDPACTYAIFLIPGHISCGKKRLNGMHICIQASIGIQLCKFCVPGITGKSFFLVPESQIIKCQGIFQKLCCPFSAGQHAGRSCQNYKCMGIALLGWNNFIVLCKTCIPTTILIIVKLASKPLQRCISQCLAAFMSKHGTNAVHMCHTACDPGFTVTVFPGSAVISKIIGASSW